MTLLPNHKSEFDKKFDELFGIRLDGLDISVINTLPQSCPRQLLPILAGSFDVDIDGLSESEARQMIQNAFEIHYYSGTLYSLNKAIKAFYRECKIKEWQDYGGEPYHFKLELEAAESGISKESFNKLDELVENYKNVRSTLGGMEISLRVEVDEIFKGVAVDGEFIRVMPEIITNVKTNVGVYYGIITHELETLEVGI